jgi:cell filamentation protein
VGEDPYVDPATGVLRNTLGIHDADQLQRVEADLAHVRVARLLTRPVRGRYDLRHLQKIHERLFGPIYPWAGEIRTVDLAKGGSMFCRPHMIETYAAHVFGTVERGSALRRLGTDKERFVERLAVHVGDLIALHPFREGNGRATRAFFTQWAGEAGHRIRWADLDPERNVEASKAAMIGQAQPFRELLAELVAPLERERGRDLER